jgi:putative colanic acid biosynthesis glycosyltransferase WcaI
MRIFLHDYGGYAFTLQLADTLAGRGHEVCYAYSETTQFVQRCDTSQVDARLKVMGIRLSSPFKKYSFVQRRNAEIEHGRLVAHEIQAFRPDVVISANTPLDTQAKILKASKKVNAKFLFWFQDAIGLATRRALSAKLGLAGNLIGAYYEAKERSIARASDHLILISDDFSSLMQTWGIGDGRFSAIPNWAPLSEISMQLKHNPWAVENGLSDKFCYLYTGILGLKHDPEIFIKLALNLQEHDNVRIVVVSEGGGAEWLLTQKSRLRLDSLIILPFQPTQVYDQVLGAADVLVSILKEDAGAYSVPSKVLSYLCAGRPILLSVPLENAAAKMVLESQAGLVAAPANDEGFLHNARLLYGNHELRSSSGKSGRSFAENEFDIERIADKFEAVF